MLLKFFVVLFFFVYFITGRVSLDCDEPPPVPNTIRQMQDGDLFYSCYPHHVLVSGDLYRCCENGVYDGDEPECVFDCGRPRTIHGTLFSIGSTLMGSTVFYDCEFPYEEFGIQSQDITCDDETKQWTHTQFTCYDGSSTNYAHNKPTLYNGNSASVLVDESESTCSTFISDYHLIEIDLGTVVNVIQFEITMGTELPNVNVSVGNSNTNILSTCKILSSPIQPWIPTVLDCNPTHSTRAPGDKLYVTAEFMSPMQMEFCEMRVKATNYSGDCGKPPTQTGQEASYSTTGENSIATIYCVSPWHAKSGSQTIVCHLTQWSKTSLVCTLEKNIAENAIAMNVDGELALDSDIESCYLGLNIGIMNPNWKIDLLELYEIYSISVTFSVNSLQMAHHIKISDDNGGTRYCQPGYPQDGVTLFNCTQGPVGKYINMTAAWPINICDVKVHGRKHQGTLECFMDSQGRDYKGYQDVTVFGKTCLPWSINSSFTEFLFPDMVTGSVGNYCRNPKTFEKERPWCFISQTEWEHCPVYACSSFCKTATDGFLFNGELSIAVSNKTCEMWDLSRFRYDFTGNTQQCQNTYKTQTQPWCITNIATDSYEFCAIPDCPTTIPPTITLMEDSTGFDYENVLQTCMHWTDLQSMAPWNPLTIHWNYRLTILDSFCPWSDKPIVRLLCVLNNLQLTFLDFICDPEVVTSANTESSINGYSETTVALTSVDPSVLSIDSLDMTSFTIASFSDQTSLSEAISVFETFTDILQQSTNVAQSDSMSEIQSSTLSDIQPSTTTELVFIIQQSTNVAQSDSMSEMQSSTLSDTTASTAVELVSNTEPMTYYLTSLSTQQLDTDTILEPSSQDSTTLQTCSQEIVTLQTSTFPLTDSESSSMVTSTPNATNATHPPCPCLCNNNPFWDEAEIAVYKLRLFDFLHLDKRNLSSTYRKKNCINDNRPLAIATGGVGITVIICVFLYLASSDVYVLYNLINRMLKT